MAVLPVACSASGGVQGFRWRAVGLRRRHRDSAPPGSSTTLPLSVRRKPGRRAAAHRSARQHRVVKEEHCLHDSANGERAVSGLQCQRAHNAYGRTAVSTARGRLPLVLKSEPEVCVKARAAAPSDAGPKVAAVYSLAGLDLEPSPLQDSDKFTPGPSTNRSDISALRHEQGAIIPPPWPSTNRSDISALRHEHYEQGAIIPRPWRGLAAAASPTRTSKCESTVKEEDCPGQRDDGEVASAQSSDQCGADSCKDPAAALPLIGQLDSIVVEEEDGLRESKGGDGAVGSPQDAGSVNHVHDNSASTLADCTAEDPTSGSGLPLALGVKLEDWARAVVSTSTDADPKLAAVYALAGAGLEAEGQPSDSHPAARLRQNGLTEDPVATCRPLVLRVVLEDCANARSSTSANGGPKGAPVYSVADTSHATKGKLGSSQQAAGIGIADGAVEKKLKTGDCGKQFEKKSEFVQHMQGHSTVKRFQCGECGKKFSRKDVLLQHERAHAERFACGACGMMFGRNDHLLLHEQTHTGVKPFQCEHCGAKFSKKFNLVAHLRVHTGEKPFDCEHCGAQFRAKSTLKAHIRVHTGEKPFDCEHCGAKFRTKTHLVAHVRGHTGEKPFDCEHCGSKFRRKGDLVKHVRVHTGEKPYSCSDCKKRFTSSSDLSRHNKTHNTAF